MHPRVFRFKRPMPLAGAGTFEVRARFESYRANLVALPNRGHDVMIIDLTGKHAIVTGSTAGIGYAIAHGLAEAGATVVINGRSQKTVDVATQRLAQHLPQAKVEGIAADLANAARVAAFVKRAPATDI